MILPGAQREFAIDLHKVLPAGRYTASAAMSFGAHRDAKISTAFRLVGPNQLPTSAVQISDFAGRADVGERAHVSGRVRSVGSDRASLRLRLSLVRLTRGRAGGRALSSRRVSFLRLAPHSERPLDVDIGGRLAKGEYRVVARYEDPTGAPQRLTSDFSVRAGMSFGDRFGLFLDRHGVQILVVVVGLMALALVLALLRRQRRLQAELRQARGGRGFGD